MRREQIDSLKDEISKAKARLDYAEVQLTRASTLARENFETQQALRLRMIYCGLDEVPEARDHILDAISDEPPMNISDGGTIRQDFTHAGYSRMESLRKNKVLCAFKYTIPDDDGDTIVTVSGYITENKTDSVEADKITEFETMIDHSGEQS